MKEILHQLRLVVYPIAYKVLAPSQVVVWDFSTHQLPEKMKCHLKAMSLSILCYGATYIWLAPVNRGMTIHDTYLYTCMINIKYLISNKTDKNRNHGMIISPNHDFTLCSSTHGPGLSARNPCPNPLTAPSMCDLTKDQRFPRHLWLAEGSSWYPASASP